MIKVIYLSFAQGTNINGPLLAKSVSAVMIRAGQGIWEDPLFRYNYQLCVDNRIPFGIWWFCQPDMKASFQMEAFMKLWNSLPVKPIVIAYDVEEIDYKDDNGVMRKLFPPSRQFNHDNVLAWCKKIAELTGAKVGIYTRKFYFEEWTFETDEWYRFWMWIAAWYNYTGQVPPALPWDWTEYKLHQYEGGGQGTPGVDPAQTCKEYFNGTLQECLGFFGGTEVPIMTALYKQDKLQKDRAKILTLEANQALKVPVSELGIDAVILPMGGMPNKARYTEPTFKGRFAQFTAAGVPVIGRFNLDAGFWLKDGHTKDEVESQSCLSGMTETQKLQSIRDNLILPMLIEAWVSGNWSWDAVFAKTVTWSEVKAIELSMVETDGYPTGTEVSDLWQTLTFNHMANCLNYLKLKGYVPNIPIILRTGPWWLQKYPVNFATMLANAKGWLYLNLGQWTLSSTATFDTLAEIFAFRPPDTFKFSAYPDLYFERILIHEYSGGAQKVKQITDAAGVPTPISLALWQSNVTDLNAFLGAAKPPVVPPVDQDIMTMLIDIRAKLDSMTAQADIDRRLIMQEQLALYDRIDRIFK